MNATMLLPHATPSPGNVYVHGMYRSGQWTCRPDQSVLVVGSGVGTAGEGGKRVSSVAVTSIVAKSSMWASFRRSSDITSYLLLTSTVKVLDPCSTTLWGPWYGCCTVQRTASCCTKTWVQWERLLLTKSLLSVMIGWSSSQLSSFASV